MKKFLRFRWLHRLYAHLFGYFWLPCPLCGEYSGGHEWNGGAIPYQTGTLANGAPFMKGKGICNKCSANLPETQIPPHSLRMVIKPRFP